MELLLQLKKLVNIKNILLHIFYNYTEKYYNFSVVVKKGVHDMYELDYKYEIDGILVKNA